jgi:hypothetical protein
VSAQGGPPVGKLSVFYSNYKFLVGREAKVEDTKSHPTTHYTVDIRQRRKGRSSPASSR